MRTGAAWGGLKLQYVAIDTFSSNVFALIGPTNVSREGLKFYP